MVAERLLLVICSLLIGFGAIELFVPFAAHSPSRFLQRVEELKQGRLPPASFVRALERRDNPDFARAVCRHALGPEAIICTGQDRATLGWAICLAAGRPALDCSMPKKASLGFGFCMAAGRDIRDCHYVEDSSPGFGLCMAARRSFNECTAVTNPSLSFAYCMERGATLDRCLNRAPQKRPVYSY